jgi:hypothetical protein
MKKEDLDALVGLYESVYSSNSGEYLSEDYIDEQRAPGPVMRQRQQAARERQNVQRAQAPTLPSSGRNVRGGSSRYQAVAADKGRGGDAAYRAGGGDAAAKGGLTRQQIQQKGMAATRATSTAPKPAGLNPGDTTPAAKPAATSPAAKPAAPGAAKVAPAAAKPATPAPGTKAAGPDSIKPKTPNPLMQRTFGYQTGNAPDQVAKTAAATATAGKNLTGTGALASKPTTPIKKPGAVMSSYEWPSAKTIRDIAGAYASIYEAKKKDQDQDGDNDFADVQIARMMASGMSKAEAIAAVKNKEYNEEFELDEATRMRKELGKEGETATRKELAARSKAYKRSGSVDKTIAAAERGADRPYIKHKRDESDSDRKKREERQSRTLRGLAASRKGSVRDKPRVQLRGYAAKVEGGDKDLQTSRQKAMSAGTLTPKEKKQLGEVYEIVASYLLENNFAETLNDANVIIENMSEVWLSQILESAE